MGDRGEGGRGPIPRRRAVIGDPATVKRELLEVGERYGAEEIVVVSITFDHQARRHSYELLAEAFELEPPPALERGSMLRA